MGNGTDPRSWGGINEVENADDPGQIDDAESAIDTVAAILALGILRLHRANAAETPDMPDSAGIPAVSSHIGLELSDLSRTDGPGG